MISEQGVIYKAQILGGLQSTRIHKKVDDWVIKHPGVYYDKNGGVSYLNGITYQNTVVFHDKVDLLAFKLTFAGFVV